MIPGTGLCSMNIPSRHVDITNTEMYTGHKYLHNIKEAEHQDLTGY